jgi:hypothetical protein
MKRSIVVAIISMLLIAAVPVISFSQESGEEGNIVSELVLELEESGWSESEVEELVNAARNLDWNAAEGASAETVALALNMSKERAGETEDGEESGLSGLEQARLALETAMTSSEMEKAGFREREIARAALEGARGAISEIRSWKEGGKEGNLGERIRKQVAETVRNRIRTAEIANARERVRKQLGSMETLPGEMSGSIGENLPGEESSDLPGPQ